LGDDLWVAVDYGSSDSAEQQEGTGQQCARGEKTDRGTAELQGLHDKGCVHAGSWARRCSSSVRMRSKKARSRSGPVVSSVPISRPAFSSSTRSAIRATSSRWWLLTRTAAPAR